MQECEIVSVRLEDVAEGGMNELLIDYYSRLGLLEGDY